MMEAMKSSLLASAVASLVTTAGFTASASDEVECGSTKYENGIDTHVTFQEIRIVGTNTAYSTGHEPRLIDWAGGSQQKT
jgi:hypothetical protein